MRRGWIGIVVGALVASGSLVLAGAPAGAAGGEPSRWEPSRARVAAALECTGDPSRGPRPALLLHGTTSSPQANWSWTWGRAFEAQHRAYCALASPDSANADIQRNGEYVAVAIKILHRRAGRPIDLVGHSQGGMVGRWALKFWPSTRTMVDDYVGLASSNHGTEAFDPACGVMQQCTPANWQQRSSARFIAALNAGRETYPGVDYTTIITRTDELVVPSASAYLTPGRNVTNVAVQDLCPTETTDHFGMAYDNAAWLIGLDALTHRGPATLGRVDASTCGQPFMPAVDPEAFAGNVAMALAQTAQSSASSPKTAAEPRLRPYAR